MLASGAVEAVPEVERDDVFGTVSVRWRPELFERAGETEAVTLYRFRVEDWTGVKHPGLPPGFEGTPPGAESG